MWNNKHDVVNERVVSVTEKWGRGQECEGGAVISERVVGVGLVEKVTFKQRLEGGSQPC